MKTFCAVLLVGIVTYDVQGTGHDCDPFALNVKTDTSSSINRTGFDAMNDELELSAFLAKPKVSFYLTHASPTSVPGSSEFCTGPTYGTDCAGVAYANMIYGNYAADRANMFEGVQFKSIFMGYDKVAEHAVEFKMITAGANDDDYIFQWVEGTELFAHTIKESNLEERYEINIHPNVLAILKSPFALYSMEVNGYALWVTCDGLYAWVTFPHEITSPDLEQDTLKAAINSLIHVAREYKGVDLEIDVKVSSMPKPFSDMIVALAAV